MLSLFHPRLQHAIVHDLGWRSLRPVQELTAKAVLGGANAVVLAPTAGGKTEAAMFPALSRILSEELSPVSILYICPIRALLNNQEERLRGYARMVGFDVFKWHGDVSDSRKQRFREQPCHVLMTTPESLEVMLLSQRTDARTLFAGLAMVVVDEIHAFAADDRGAHLMALLERLVWVCGKDVQRIGLSATVGNPTLIGQWLQGSSERPLCLVNPPRPPSARDLCVEWCGEGLRDTARAIAQRARGRKSLVFVESRAKAEDVAQALQGSDVEVFIHHSSVSRADRAVAEEQFARGQNTAIVCTSTMELGIDVGDLDQVIQVDAPSSVASMLQRLGRTGRREGTRANCTFMCQSTESLLQVVALLRLAQRGWVEDVRPARLAMHVLAHQVLALTLQEGGISRHSLLPWIEAAYPFCGIDPPQLDRLVDVMISRDILYEADSLLSLGSYGEKLYGRKNFFELYAIFSAPPLLRVIHGRQEVGYVQAMFVAQHDQERGALCFRLAGRAWEAGQIDWGRGLLYVQPAEHGKAPHWLGAPGLLSTSLCQEMRAALQEAVQEEGLWLSRAAQVELRALRDSYDGLWDAGEAPLEEHSDGVQWHTFAGGAVNRLLAAGLEEVTKQRWLAGNLSIKAKGVAVVAARDALSELRAMPWERVAQRAARVMARSTLSKFQPCLPPEAEDKLVAERLLDVDGTLRFLGRDLGLPASRWPSAPAQQVAPSKTRLGEAVLGNPSGLPSEAASVPLSAGDRNLNFAKPRNPVIWVDTTEKLAMACSAMCSEAILGLDVETTLDFGALCLIQLASPTQTWLIDPLALEDLSLLKGVLEAQAPLKIIHNASFERRALSQRGLCVVGVIDTLALSRKVRGYKVEGGHSLAKVCDRELGVAVDKDAQTSPWSRRPLSQAQIDYAALDAEILIALYDALSLVQGEQRKLLL
jgi:ATP-dependent Lhr-like helicase